MVWWTKSSPNARNFLISVQRRFLLQEAPFLFGYHS